MRKTPLYDHHEFFDAKMVNFAGFEMPLYYTSIEDEHEAVRLNAGYFDVSHMGEILIEGKGATRVVNKVFSNTLPEIGQARYGFLLNVDAFPIDDILVYKFEDEKYWIVCNASNTQKVKEHIHYQFYDGIFDGHFEDISEKTALVAVQGPSAKDILKGILDDDLDIKRFRFKELSFQNTPIIVSRTGYTGEDGFEIYASNKVILKIWELLAETSALPCGLGARDTLRFEAGYPLYGEELIGVLTPISSHLEAFIDYSKTNTIGIKALIEKKAKGIQDFLTGLELQEKGIARSGYGVYDGDKRIGEITTGYKLRNYKNAKALAFMKLPYTKIGTEVEIEIREKRVKAKVIPFPFYQKLKKKKV